MAKSRVWPKLSGPNGLHCAPTHTHTSPALRLAGLPARPTGTFCEWIALRADTHTSPGPRLLQPCQLAVRGTGYICIDGGLHCATTHTEQGSAQGLQRSRPPASFPRARAAAARARLTTPLRSARTTFFRPSLASGDGTAARPPGRHGTELQPTTEHGAPSPEPLRSVSGNHGTPSSG